jgi:hypothetical protein
MSRHSRRTPSLRQRAPCLPGRGSRLPSGRTSSRPCSLVPPVPRAEVRGLACTAGLFHRGQARKIAGRHQRLPVGHGEDADLVVLLRVQDDAADLRGGQTATIEDHPDRAVGPAAPRQPEAVWNRSRSPGSGITFTARVKASPGWRPVGGVVALVVAEDGVPGPRGRAGQSPGRLTDVAAGSDAKRVKCAGGWSMGRSGCHAVRIWALHTNRSSGS